MPKKVLYWIGAAIALGSLGYVAHTLYTNQVWVIEARILKRLAVVWLVGSVLYGVVSFTLSAAWRLLLIWSGEKEASAIVCHGIYGRAQLAKYIPGNIFSFVGRHALARQSGFAHQTTVWAAVLEIIGTLFCAALIAMIGAAYWNDLDANIPRGVVTVFVVGLLLLPFLSSFLFRRSARFSRFSLPDKKAWEYLQLGAIFLIYVPFFLVGGTGLWAFLQVLAPLQSPIWGEVIALATTAWIIGYVTPGASGGLGIRDGILLFALAVSMGEYSASLAVVAYRLMTVMGDLIFFMLAHLFPLKAKAIPFDNPPADNV